GVELMLNTAYEEDARPPAPDSARIAAHDDTAILLRVPGCGWGIRAPSCTRHCCEGAQDRALWDEAVVRERCQPLRSLPTSRFIGMETRIRLRSQLVNLEVL